MTRIDTNGMRGVISNCRVAQDNGILYADTFVERVADELDRLYALEADNTPPQIKNKQPTKELIEELILIKSCLRMGYEVSCDVEELFAATIVALCEQAEKLEIAERSAKQWEAEALLANKLADNAWQQGMKIGEENRQLKYQLAAANERADKAEECIFSMWETDKTPRYEYTDTKSNKNRFGELPKGIGARWRTPREIAQSLLGEQQLIEKHDAALAQEGKNDNV